MNRFALGPVYSFDEPRRNDPALHPGRKRNHPGAQAEKTTTAIRSQVLGPLNADHRNLPYPWFSTNILVGQVQRQLGEAYPKPALHGSPHVFYSDQGACSAKKTRHTAQCTPHFLKKRPYPQGSQDDVEIVRLAVAIKAILVTTDNPLIADLQTAGITDQYQLQVVTPEQAINLL